MKRTEIYLFTSEMDRIWLIKDWSRDEEVWTVDTIVD